MDTVIELTLSAKDVAEITKSSVDDIRNWSRLAEDHPRHLPSIKIDGQRRFLHTEVLAWLQRPANERLMEVVIAAYVPLEIRATYLPQARSMPAPAPASTTAGLGLMGLTA